ncbi:MAG: non-homologous end-joining DNA ligase [Actinomycetota bacterium]|nr:non-homologous end-joining DNA ligase [Actinomycetota bacterium]
MLATAGELPPDPELWAFEFKWDGVRALARCEAGDVRLLSRRGVDIGPTYPELAGLAAATGCPVLLDGEIVALDDRGRPSFTRLQQRIGVDPRGATARARQIPVVYLAFDVLHLRGHATRELPYRDRRELLASLDLASPAWQVPGSYPAAGEVTLEAARSLGLEGVVAKRLASRYEPGRRTRAWRKVKLLLREEFVVGGWLPGEGLRSERIGALLLGQYDADHAHHREGWERGKAEGGPRLVYRGRVGTGFSEAELDRLRALLQPLRRATSPFDAGEPPHGGRWVEPQIVVEVAYQEDTPAGIVRHPRYQGRRDDKPADQVVRELQR